MARPLRLEYAGALYHVTARGDGREDIYVDDGDRDRFLGLLSEVIERYNWVCHAYCLMSNHYHLLIETPDGNLSKGMRQLNGVYTQTFNRVHRRVGHVFQGRYKAILVEKEAYLLELARYIVLNPVRARMVGSPADWPWSSYLATCGDSEPPCWMSTEWLLSPFGDSAVQRRSRYKEFVASGLSGTSPWTLLRSQIFLGSEAFVSAHQAPLDNAERDLREVPRSQRRPPARPLADYLALHPERDEGIRLAYSSGHYSLKEIGDYLGLHYSRVSRIVRKAKDKT